MSIKEIFEDFKKNVQEQQAINDLFERNQLKMTCQKIYDSKDSFWGKFQAPYQHYELTLSFGDKSCNIYMEQDGFGVTTRIQNDLVKHGDVQYEKEDVTEKIENMFMSKSKNIGITNDVADLIRDDVFNSNRFNELSNVIGETDAFSVCVMNKVFPDSGWYSLPAQDLKILMKEWPIAYDSSPYMPEYDLYQNVIETSEQKFDKLKTQLDELRKEPEWQIGGKYDTLASKVGLTVAANVYQYGSINLKELPMQQLEAISPRMSINDMSEFQRLSHFTATNLDLFDPSWVPSERTYIGYLCVNESGERLMREEQKTMRDFLSEFEGTFIKECNDEFYQSLSKACEHDTEEQMAIDCFLIIEELGDKRFLLNDNMKELLNNIEEKIDIMIQENKLTYEDINNVIMDKENEEMALEEGVAINRE